MVSLSQNCHEVFLNNINFIRYGKKNGYPIIFLHGFPGSAKHGFIFHQWAEEFGVEIFSLDRPGYGLTLPTKEKGLKSWTSLFQHFLTSHKIEQFSVIGISGGAPYAVAIASAFPQKVKKLGIICGLAPWTFRSSAFSPIQNIALSLFRRVPESVMNPFLSWGFINEDYGQTLDKLASRLNSADQETLAMPEIRKIMIEGMIQARRQGFLGIQNDLYQYSRPWPVEWDKIIMPCHLWYGLEDLMLNPKMAKIFKQKIPQIKIRYFESEGHFSLPILRAKEILDDFTKDSI